MSLDPREDQSRTKLSGVEESWIDFNYFSRIMNSISEFVYPKRIWILIDEWTTVPFDMQPYLADLINRSTFNNPDITVKIAAIEHRSNFKCEIGENRYIGLELGADISAPINLDDYLVLENNEERAKEFFGNFIAKHTISVLKEMDIQYVDILQVISSAFTQENVFTEFVRASEGVPRDAMHILTIAAQRCASNQISMPEIRNAAYSFFQVEKYASVQSGPGNRILLEWIRDEVIEKRKTRAFLMPVAVTDPIIDRLFDRRALHILNRSRSAAHKPGERFTVYKLDYGLYVDLINTQNYPAGLLLNAEVCGGVVDVEFDVPSDDARSYRRAILDVEEFYKKYPELKQVNHGILRVKTGTGC